MMTGNRSRSARATLLWGLALFALGQLGLGIALENCLSRFRDPSYANRVASLKSRLLENRTNGPEPALIIMLGSSRTANGLRGCSIEAALQRELGRPALVQNLGVPGGGPMLELLYWGRLLHEEIRPTLLLIEVLPVFLDESAVRDPAWLPADCLSWRDLSLLDAYQLPEATLCRQWVAGFLLPCWTHRTTIVQELIHDIWPRYRQQHWSHRCDGSGWLPQPVERFAPDTSRQARERARLEYQEKLRGFRLGDPSCDALRRLLAECGREGVPAALVLMPEGSHFQSWYSAEARREIDSFL